MTDKRILLISGNQAVVYGALDAGLTFFAGYPITPSSEIAEEVSRLLPRQGGRFIQMEDEISSMGAIIGASLAGAKTMTATSGPGFSLKQENLGYACMTEVPCVVINVMRGGPSTGLPTLTSQGDVMQARWGTHGDHPIIALVPASVQEAYEQTVKAFNFSEKYRIPAVVLLDETIGHMREKVLLPAKESLEIVNRKKPEEPAEHFLPYRNTPELVNPMPAFGSGYRYHVTGLAYDETGFPTNDTQTIADLMHRLNHKMVRFGPEMEQLETTEIKDADICLFAYGSVARSAKLAQRWGREKNIKVGLIKTSTLWPFPYDTLRKRLKNMRAVVAAEQNLGMITGELMKTVPFDRVFHVGRADGETLTPFQILAKIEEVAHAVAV